MRTDPRNAFCSVHEPWEGAVTCWTDWHNRLAHHMPVEVLGGHPGWLQVVHGHNVSNRVRGRLVDPARYAAVLPPLDGLAPPGRGALLADGVGHPSGRCGRVVAAPSATHCWRRSGRRASSGSPPCWPGTAGPPPSTGGADVDVRALLRALLRRWYAAAAALALALALTVAAADTVPVTTTARATVLLLPPTADLDGSGNPYLYLGGLNQATDVLVARLDSDAVAEPVQERHPGAAILVARDGTTTGPMLLVTATSADPAEASAAVQDVLAVLPTELGSLQEALGVTDRSAITSSVLTGVDREPPDTTGRTRALIAVGGLGAGTALLLTWTVDRLLGRRSERRRARADRAGADRAGDLPSTPSPVTPSPGAPPAGLDDEPSTDDAPVAAR
ncbi:glycosyltransferase [Nocardioides zeae]